MGSVVSLDCAAMVVIVVEVADYSSTRGRFAAVSRAHEPLERRLVFESGYGRRADVNGAVSNG